MALVNEVIQDQYKGNLNTFWLDFKKAFDSMPHNFVLSILKKMPINKAIPKLIERIYRDPSTSLELLIGKIFQRIGSISFQKESSGEIVCCHYCSYSQRNL